MTTPMTSATTSSFRPPVTRATASDVDQIVGVVRQRAPETIPVTSAQVRRGLDRYRVIRENGRVIATATLQPVADGRRLELRSVAVADGHGGRGLGTHIVRALQDEARRRGRRVVCVTTSPGFFERLGFEEAPLSLVPPKPERRRWPIDGRRVAMSWRPTTDRRNDHVRSPLRRSA